MFNFWLDHGMPRARPHPPDVRNVVILPSRSSVQDQTGRHQLSPKVLEHQTQIIPRF